MPKTGRLSRLFDNSKDDLDAVVIANGSHTDPNFFYLSGYTSGLFEGNMLFVFPDERVEVLTNPLEESAARLKDHKVHVERTFAPEERKKMVTSILKGAKNVGVNFGGVSHKDYQTLQTTLRKRTLLDVSEAIAETRMVKDPDELRAMAKSAEIISKVVDGVPEAAEEGMTEKALKAEIDYLMVEGGADSPSFESIVAFGEGSAQPHYSAGDRRLRSGDNVLIDVGARYHLYCSDITRTFFFGRAKPRQREAYAKVLEAKDKATATIREGASGRDVHLVAARVIDSSKFKGRFIHGLGHSLGLEVHDGPGLSMRSKLKLARDSVMTVEPGIYIPGEGGVRIEDDVVVGKGSCRALTTASTELVEI